MADFGNMADIMKQAKAMQEKMQEAQNKLKDLTIKGQAGAGELAVSVEINGDFIPLGGSLTIPPALFERAASGEGKAQAQKVLKALIESAFSHAAKEMKEKTQHLMTSMAGDMNLPSELMKGLNGNQDQA